MELGMMFAVTAASGWLGRAVVKGGAAPIGNDNVIGIARTPAQARHKRIVQHRHVIEAAQAAGVKNNVCTSVQGPQDGTAFAPIVQGNRQTEADVKASGDGANCAGVGSAVTRRARNAPSPMPACRRSPGATARPRTCTASRSRGPRWHAAALASQHLPAP